MLESIGERKYRLKKKNYLSVPTHPQFSRLIIETVYEQLLYIKVALNHKQFSVIKLEKWEDWVQG